MDCLFRCRGVLNFRKNFIYLAILVILEILYVMKRFSFLILIALFGSCEPNVEPQYSQKEENQQFQDNEKLLDSDETDVGVQDEDLPDEGVQSTPGDADGVLSEKYIFHDDFYYYEDYDTGNKQAKWYLESCLDEHYVRFKTEYQEEVIAELLKRGFQIVKGPHISNYDLIDNPNKYEEDEYFEIPDEVKYGSVVHLKGKGEIADISNIVYSNHYYVGSGISFGITNKLYVKYDINRADEQVELIRKFAKQHNIYPLVHWPDMGYVHLICTNESSGNSLEMANWFVEVGGFVGAGVERLIGATYE